MSVGRGLGLVILRGWCLLATKSFIYVGHYLLDISFCHRYSEASDEDQQKVRSFLFLWFQRIVSVQRFFVCVLYHPCYQLSFDVRFV